MPRDAPEQIPLQPTSNRLHCQPSTKVSIIRQISISGHRESVLVRKDFGSESFCSLRITADISHWVVLSERLLDESEEDRELLERVFPHVSSLAKSHIESAGLESILFVPLRPRKLTIQGRTHPRPHRHNPGLAMS